MARATYFILRQVPAAGGETWQVVGEEEATGTMTALRQFARNADTHDLLAGEYAVVSRRALNRHVIEIDTEPRVRVVDLRFSNDEQPGE